MTSEHDSAPAAATSLRDSGEVCGAPAPHPLRLITDAQRGHAGVVGDSMSGKECTREDGRPARVGHSKECLAEVRTIIRAKKRGNARGAKDGRKAELRTDRKNYTIRNRLLRELEHRSLTKAVLKVGAQLRRQLVIIDGGGSALFALYRAIRPRRRQTADWRAVCGRSARTVRREGRRKPMRCPYLYP